MQASYKRQIVGSIPTRPTTIFIGAYMPPSKMAKESGYRTTRMMNSAYRRYLKQQIFEAQNGICYWCKKPMSPDDRILLRKNKLGDEYTLGPRYPTLDHIIPSCDGGTNGRENLVLACHSCNLRRGNTYASNGKSL